MTDQLQVPMWLSEVVHDHIIHMILKHHRSYKCIVLGNKALTNMNEHNDPIYPILIQFI